VTNISVQRIGVKRRRNDRFERRRISHTDRV